MSVKHTFKGRNGPVTENLTPIRAIRRFCAECYGWANWEKEVRECPSLDCPIYPFRLGKVPGAKRDMTPEQRKVVGDRLRNSRKLCTLTGVEGQNS
jgi:hypothetical protein